MEINWQLLMPYLVIIVTFILVLIYDMIDSLSKRGLAWLTILGSLVASVVSVNMLTAGLVSTTEFSGMLRIDQYSLFQIHIAGDRHILGFYSRILFVCVQDEAKEFHRVENHPVPTNAYIRKFLQAQGYQEPNRF